MCFFTLVYKIHDIHYMKNFVEELESLLRKCYFRGQEDKGLSKKTRGQTALKSRGGSLAIGSYLQRGSAPPPPYFFQGAPAAL